MNLPYKQFTNIDYLNTSERFYKKKNEIKLPYRFKQPTKMWNTHTGKNKYFGYIHPLNSHYYKENSYNNSFKNIKKRKNTKTKNLLYVLFKINFKEFDNFNILWNQIYEKVKNNTKDITWTQFFNNIYNDNLFNVFDKFSPEIELE